MWPSGQISVAITPPDDRAWPAAIRNDDLDEDRESFESTVKNLQKKLKGDFVVITPQYWGGRGSKALAA